MERAHVLIRLRGDVRDATSKSVGICRTSPTTIRLEHSDMSPGVASITFEQVYDVHDSTLRILETSLVEAVASVVHGKAVTLVATGAKDAGKSFVCHGHKQKQRNGMADPGLITLAIQQIFKGLNETFQNGEMFNVLLSCWSVECSNTGTDSAFVELVAEKTRVDVKDIKRRMIECAVPVKTSDEAMRLYLQALENVDQAEKHDFVFALHVETQWPNREVRRGRWMLIDIHGDSILEPRDASTVQGSPLQKRDSVFADTSFKINEPLSAGLGSFVGAGSSTYFVVAIQTSAKFQQQAIQSLLYACKAKEIKSSSSIEYLPCFVKKSATHSLIETQSTLPQNADSQVLDGRDDMILSKASPLFRENQSPDFFPPTSSPPLSTTSNGSSFDGLSTVVNEEPVESLSPTLTKKKSESDAARKQSALSRRLRMAYDIAKQASTVQSKQSVACLVHPIETTDAADHTALDALLPHLSHDTLRGLSLSAKVEQVRASYVELERALAHETSIKDKCVARISRLSQTLSCQVVEHEKQLQAAMVAKHAVEKELRDLSAKFEEVRSLKADQKTYNGHPSVNERAMLHTLSARLEEAMIEAKEVITFKDGVIYSLEKRLELASQRGTDAVTRLEEEKSHFEREKTELQLSKESSIKTKDEEILRLNTEKTALQQQKTQFSVEVAQLTFELESARSQWTQEARTIEDRAEQKWAQQLAQAEQQLEQVTNAMQQQMAQFRSEFDLKVARQRVAARVACKASELKCDHLERTLEHLKSKLAKQKITMEKKARAVAAKALKESEKPITLLKRELQDSMKRLTDEMTWKEHALERAEISEGDVERLQADLKQLQVSLSELERERTALSTVCQQLKRDHDLIKAELELRTHEVEELRAQHIRAAQVRVHEKRDDHDHHKDENGIFQAETEDRETGKASFQLLRTPSVSAVSSPTSPSGELSCMVFGGSPQKRIDELDALIVSKERRYEHFEKQRKGDENVFKLLKRTLAQKEDEIVTLIARQKQLLAALAIANEQETRAKQQKQETEAQRQNEAVCYEDVLQQLNTLKQENWNLSLALQVTETANQH